MSELTIITNNVPRPIIYGWEIPEVRDEFDWISDDDFDMSEFFRYKGRVYSLDEFMHSSAFPSFDGYAGDSYFSGVLVRLCSDGDHVVVGRYYS